MLAVRSLSLSSTHGSCWRSEWAEVTTPAFLMILARLRSSPSSSSRRPQSLSTSASKPLCTIILQIEKVDIFSVRTLVLWNKLANCCNWTFNIKVFQFTWQCSPVKALQSHHFKLYSCHSPRQCPSPALLQHTKQCTQGLMWDIVQFKHNLKVLESKSLSRPCMMCYT